MTADDFVVTLLNGYLPVFVIAAGLVSFAAGFHVTRNI
jgi:hypothetical protein